MAECSAEMLATIAALVSAVGTVFAARSAHKSAQSAQSTERAAAESERRTVLRQIALTSVDVVTEAKRINSRGEATKVAYNDLAAFTGNVGSSRLEMSKQEITKKVATAKEKAEHAQLFQDPSEKLKSAPNDELERVQTSLSSNLRQLLAVREELEEECAYVQGQCAQYREKAIRGAGK